MGKRALLPFLLVAALGWGVFAAAGLWFTSRLEDQYRQDRRDELALVAGQTAANVAGYVERVTRAVGSVLAEPISSADGTPAALSMRFRILSHSYPEIQSLVFLDSSRQVHIASPGQALRPTDLQVADVFEARTLDRLMGQELSPGLHVTVTDITRYVPALDRMVPTPVLLFVQRLAPPDGEVGTVLVPYLLDFIAETLLKPLAALGDRELALIGPRGTAVYGTLPPAFDARDLPSFKTSPGTLTAADLADVPPRPASGDQPYFSEFQMPTGAGDLRRLIGRFAPLELGNTRWTLVVAGHDHPTGPGRSSLLAPPLLGSLVLVLLLCGVTLAASARARRQLAEIVRFRTAVESSSMGIAVFDRDDRYLYVNPAYSAITGQRPEDVRGNRVHSRSYALDDPGLLAQVLPQVRAGEPWEGRARLRGPDTSSREWRDMAFTVSPILEHGEFQGYVTTALDVTSEAQAHRQLEDQAGQLAAAKTRLEEDLRAREVSERERALLQQELRRSQTLEAVGQLAGGVAHDFNNILGSIIGCLYAVQQQVTDNPDVTRELESVKELCKRGGDLNRQLLAVGRRETGPREPVDTAEFLGNLDMLLRRTLPPDITLVVDTPSTLPATRGNRSNLLAAFLNLGLNARDAMSAGGRLEIRARVETGAGGRAHVVIEVEDTGDGIPEEVQDRVFEPFFTTKTPGLGTGLGLATAHAAVEECGGTLKLRSTLGVGTCFTVHLPVLERRAKLRESGLPPTVHPATTGPVLVVEDEAGIQRLICGTLEGAGYTVLTAANGAEALNRLGDGEPLGAVTLDLMLPEVSGSEVLRELQRSRPEVPVLLVTARDDLARSTLRGLPFLSKPFTSAELLTALGELLRPAPTGKTGQHGV